MVNLGLCYFKKKQYDLAEKYYLMVKKCGDIQSYDELKQWHDQYYENTHIDNTNINNIISLHGITNNFDKQYDLIVRAYDRGYDLNYNGITNYVQSLKINIAMLKYKNKCIPIRTIFLKHSHIILFLHIVGKPLVQMPVYIKLNIICLFI